MPPNQQAEPPYLAVRLRRLWRARGLGAKTALKSSGRPVAQLAEQRIPNPQVGGSIPSWPATFALKVRVVKTTGSVWLLPRGEAT